MKSIRVWLFGLFPLIAIASMIATDFRSSLVATNDWRDLSINGRGYIETVDGNGENPSWARSVRLGVNQFGLLCANVKGSLRPFEPPIHVQSGWTRIEIDTNGQIKIGTPGSSEISIGSIFLTMFFGEDVNASVQLENPDDRFGPPMVVEPGSSGAGYLMQRTAFQYCLPLTLRTSLAFAFFALWLTGGIVFTWKIGKH